MRLKLNFGKGGLKGFVSHHAEKAIFGLVLCLVAFFIYSSATQEVEETGSPEDLKRNASSARSGLDQDYWDAIRPEREKEVEDYGGKAEEGRKPIDEADYALSNIWDPGVTPRRGKRGDPKMLGPQLVEASGGVFNIPIRTASREDFWENDKDAVAKPKEEAKPWRRRPKKKKPSRGYMGGSSDGDMLSGAAGGGSEYGEEEEEMGSGYMGSGMDDEGSMGPGAMMTSGMTGGRRTIGKIYRDLYIKGYQGTFSQMGAQGALGRSYAVVGVTATVPYEKQWEEYERALAGTTGYSAKQDIPKYLFFLAERAEVSADPNAPLDWKPISNSNYAMKLSARYAAFPKEVADEAYTVPGVLTMPIPPIMLKSFDDIVVHSDIPRQQVKRIQVASTEEAPDEEEPIEIESSELSPGDLSIPKVGPGTTGGGGMYGPGAGGSGMYAPEGSGSMMGSAEGSSSFGSGSEMDYGDGDEGMYDEEGSGYGSGGGYGTPFGNEQELTVVKHKMVRFFDLTAEPGKSYRYRVAVVLEDPNHPRDPQAAPSTRILDAAVAKRVREVEAKDAETSTRTGQTTRTFYLQTDWSEASNVVTVAKPEKYVAGGATHGKVIPLSDSIEIQTTESKGKLVTMVWDDNRAAEIPAEKEVFRGSYLSFTEDADALHPLTQQIKTIEGFEFNTDAFVADLRGGKKLITDIDEENDDEETIHYTPGEFLVIDGEGNLLACNEIDDTEEFRRLTFAEDTAQPITASGGGMPGDYGDMMDYGEFGSGMDMEDDGGGGGEEH